MTKYLVGITGKIYVIAEFEVEAANPAEAEKLALKKAYGSDSEPWCHYTDVPDSDTLQVEDIDEID